MNGIVGNDAVLWDILITSVIGVPILLYIYRKNKTEGRNENLSLTTCIRLFSLGAGLSAVFRLLIIAAGGLGYKEDVAGLFSGKVCLEILVLVIMAPVFEELLFRGVIYERLKLRISVISAIVISALLFGLYHGNLSQGIYGFLMGIAFAWAMERYRTVTAPLLIHVGVNAAALLLERVFLL